MPSLYIIRFLNDHCEATTLANRMRIATVERLEFKMRVNVWTVFVAFWERRPGLVRGSPYFEALFVHNVFFIMSIILIRQSHICHRYS